MPGGLWEPQIAEGSVVLIPHSRHPGDSACTALIS